MGLGVVACAKGGRLWAAAVNGRVRAGTFVCLYADVGWDAGACERGEMRRGMARGGAARDVAGMRDTVSLG